MSLIELIKATIEKRMGVKVESVYNLQKFELDGYMATYRYTVKADGRAFTVEAEINLLTPATPIFVGEVVEVTKID